MVISLIPWLNFLSLIICGVIFVTLYILSVIPVTRAEKRGKKAWKESRYFRLIAVIFAFITVLNILFWYWFPIPELAWLINLNPWIGIILGIALAIPGAYLVIRGMLDTKKETIEPSTQTKLAGGIYQYIRHPQVLGRGLWFIAFTLWVNSLFLLSVVTVFVIIIIPIIIHFEEKDLIKRFGNSYLEYKQHTGAIFPKMRKRKAKERR